jgi:hypothetical protein
MDKLICQCCGAPLDPKTLICSYCGTAHKRNNDYLDRPIMIETFRQPVETFTTSVMFDNELLMMNPEMASCVAMREVTNKLAESLMHMVCFESRRDFRYGLTTEVRGTIKVVRPVCNFKEVI